MPWYYAGADAKPVGPLSLEELHAARLNGKVTAETYVIKQGGATAMPDWRRYREVFPDRMPTLPPVPPPPSVPLPMPGQTGIPSPHMIPPTAAHPLFPSAPYAPQAALHGHYSATNGLCAWGFGLGLASVFLAFMCGIGLLTAIPGLILSILGLVQVQRHRRQQSGKGLAIAGVVLSILGLLFAMGLIGWGAYMAYTKERQDSTQQSSE